MDYILKILTAGLGTCLLAFVVFVGDDYVKVLALKWQMPPGPLPLPLFSNLL